MSGPPAKHQSVRARANKTSTRATLTERTEDELEEFEIPALPPRHVLKRKDGQEYYVEEPWHPLTLEWWVDIWESPMSGEFHSSDRHGLFRVAALIDNFWKHPNKDTHAEVRLAQKDYGLTPMDRRRLEWTIESADKARADGDKRRAAAAPPKPPSADEQDKTKDPRIALGDNVVQFPAHTGTM
jgi:hypothetical protein